MFFSLILGVVSGQQQTASSLSTALAQLAPLLSRSAFPLVTHSVSQESGASNDALAALVGQQGDQTSVHQQPASPSLTSLQQAVNSSQQPGAQGTSFGQPPAAQPPAVQPPAVQTPPETLQTTQTSNAMAVDPKVKKTPDPSDRFARKIEEAKAEQKSEKENAKDKKKRTAIALKRHQKVMEKRKAGPRASLPQQKIPPGHFSCAPAASPTSPLGMTVGEHLTVLESSGRAAAREADEMDKKLEASVPAPEPAPMNPSGKPSPSQQQLESDISSLQRDLEQDLNEFNQFTGGSNDL